MTAKCKGRLEGRVALVTGGSRGIGKAICLRLAHEGANVVINYQSSKKTALEVSKLVDQIGTAHELERVAEKINHTEYDHNTYSEELLKSIDKIESHSYISKANVADIDQVNSMRDKVIEKFGRLDILVNNAGIVRDKSFAKMTPEMWHDVISVNLDGTFYCTKAFIGDMLEQKYGRIINISSVVGRMGNFGQANYTASKAGIIGLTKSLAKEFAGKGITVNAVAPGFIGTDMVQSIPDDIKNKIIDKIPLRRLGITEEVAGSVTFLASKDGDYITGQVIDINGGVYL